MKPWPELMVLDDSNRSFDARCMEAMQRELKWQRARVKVLEDALKEIAAAYPGGHFQAGNIALDALEGEP